MIKFIFRWAFRFLILAIVLIVALLLLKDEILKTVAEAQIRKNTGMEVKIGSISTSLTQPVFHLENFVLYNTARFSTCPTCASSFIPTPRANRNCVSNLSA